MFRRTKLFSRGLLAFARALFARAREEQTNDAQRRETGNEKLLNGFQYLILELAREVRGRERTSGGRRRGKPIALHRLRVM